MHSYRICGLSVQSDQPLPGLITMSAGRNSADVIIRQHPVPEALEAATAMGAT